MDNTEQEGSSTEDEPSKELERVHRRLIRWEDMRRAHLSTANNLLMTFSVAILAFVTKEFFEHIGKEENLKDGFEFLGASLLAGIFVVFSRLFDYRYTVSKIRHQEKWLIGKKTDQDEFCKMNFSSKITNCLGRLTWILLALQSILFLWACYYIGIFILHYVKP